MTTFLAMMLFIAVSLPPATVMAAQVLFEDSSVERSTLVGGILLVETLLIGLLILTLTSWMQAVLMPLGLIMAPIFHATLKKLYQKPRDMHSVSSATLFICISTTIVSLILYTLLLKLPYVWLFWVSVWLVPLIFFSVLRGVAFALTGDRRGELASGQE